MGQLFARISGVRSAVPERLLSNEELAAEFPEWGVEQIYQKTGIHTRRLAGPGQSASDLGVSAARRLFDDGLADPGEIDFLLYCTQSPDYPLPTTACLIQDRLGLPNSCGALDFNLGCSGFVYGLSLAKGLIETGQAETILLLTAETYSKYLHPQDKSVRTIFGDGAAATLIRAVPADSEWLGPFVFGTDGRGGKNLIVRPAPPSPGPSMPPGAEGRQNGANCQPTLFMNGPEIFSFTLRVVPEMVRALLKKTNQTVDRIDSFVLHQANRFMVDALGRKLGIPESKLGFHLHGLGNTVSATIPMTLELLTEQGKIAPGEQLLVIGFGVGYSWAGCRVYV